MDKVPWVGNGWVMGRVWVQLSSPKQDSVVNATPEHKTSQRKHHETRAKWRKELEEEEE
jgi:hypothetical protein